MSDDRGRDALAWLLARAPRVRTLSLGLRARADAARPAPLALGAAGLWSTGPHGDPSTVGWGVALRQVWHPLARRGGNTPGGASDDASESASAAEEPATPAPYEDEAPEDDGPPTLEVGHQFVDAPLLFVSTEHTSEEVSLDTFDTHLPDDLSLEVDDLPFDARG